MSTTKQKKLRKQITDLLIDKGLFEKPDEVLIDELLYQQYLIEESKQSIKNYGIMINIRPDDQSPYFQVNQAVSVYRDSVKSLVTICTKLGITPQERSKLKLIERKQDFDVIKFAQGDSKDA